MPMLLVWALLAVAAPFTGAQGQIADRKPPLAPSEVLTIPTAAQKKPLSAVFPEKVDLSPLAAESAQRLRRLPVQKDTAVVIQQRKAYEKQREKHEAEEKATFDRILREVGLNRSARQGLQAAAVKTFSELRTGAGKQALSKLPKTARRKTVKASRLSLLSSEPKVVSALIRRNISLSDFRKLTNEEIQKKSKGEISADTAEQLRNRARIVESVIALSERAQRGYERNPPTVYLPEGLVGQQRMIARQTAGPIQACSPHDNVFSPATYLVHLLDFITKWMEISLLDLKKVILMQRIEDLLMDLDASDEIGYVTLSNRILENVIARFSSPSQALPNDHISWGWKGLHLPASDAVKNQIRIDIYDEFKKKDGGRYVYEDDPGFDPSVIVKLFDSYVREFGTTRREVSFVSKSSKLKDRLKKEHNLTDSDLTAIEKNDEEIDLASVETLAEKLLEFYERKKDKTLRQEYIEAYAESRRTEFMPVFRQKREAQIDRLLEVLLQGNLDSANGEDLDAILLKKQSEAAACVRSGESCPSGYSTLLPVKELLRQFASSHQDYDLSARTPDEFADWKYGQLIAELTEERFEQLLEEHGNGTLPAETLSQLQAQAKADAANDVTSEAVFERQLALLGEFQLSQELQNQGSQHPLNVQREQNAEDSWRTAVSRAELPYLQEIRRNLIVLALHRLVEKHPDRFSYKTVSGKQIAFHARNLDFLQDYLLFDVTAIESHKTTALAFGIARLHTLVHALRIGKPETKHMDEVLARTWGWARSYGIWHAAKMVAAYPENFLIPEIRRQVSNDFRLVTAPLAEALPDNLEEMFSSYRDRIAEFIDMELDAAVPVGEQLFLFAHNDTSIKYSVLNPRGIWSGWRTIEDLAPHLMVKLPSGQVVPITPRKEQYSVTYRRDGVANEPNIYLLRFISAHLECDPDKECAAFRSTLHYAAFKTTEDGTLVGALETEGEEAETAAEWVPIDGASIDANGRLDTGGYSVARRHFGRSFGLSIRGPIYRAVKKQTFELAIDVNFIEGIPTARHCGEGHGRACFRKTGFVTPAWPVADPSGEVIFWHQIGGHHWGKECAIGGSEITQEMEEWLEACRRESEQETEQQDPAGTVDAIYYEDWRTGEKKFLGLVSPGSRGFAAAAALNGDALLSYYRLSGDYNGLQVRRLSNVGGDFRWVSGEEFYTQVPPDQLYDRLAFFSDRIFALGHRIYEDHQGDPFPGTEIIYARSDLLEIEPLRLSFQGKIQRDGFQLSPFYYKQFTKSSDPIRLYLDEYLLHLPMLLADMLNTEGRYDDAIRVLQRVTRNPLRPGCGLSDPICFPGFGEINVGAPAIEAWLVEPFNPYALADLDKRHYAVGWLTAYVQNLVDWADWLFTMDSPETVNLAREKYEYAGAILGLPYWPIESEEGTPNSLETSIGDISGEPASPEGLLPDQLVLLGLAAEIVEVLGEVTIQEDIPDLAHRCLPANPRLAVLQWHIQSHLSKISRNQNIAGMERDLQLYATPVDPSKLVRQAAVGQLDFEEAVPSTPPPIYRFSFLIERAKYLVGVANQFESSMLVAIKQGEEEEYTELRARQDLSIQNGSVILQQLRVQEANDQVRLASAQQQRAVFSQGHYEDLLYGGLSSWEDMALFTLGISLAAPSSISVSYGAGAGASVSYSPSGILQTMASMMSTQASYERRADEWRYQAGISGLDIDIADVGIDIADSHMRIAAKEEAQARLSYGFSKDNVEFLSSRFGNAELYHWMRKQLRRLYRAQLNMAFATAKAAQKALEFERQTSLDFIGFEYWNDIREGLLGSEQLLSDISKLEQFRISTAQRKKEIETTFSLASVIPEELQRLRDVGVMDFRTLKSWFDRQFPGHYLRLIKNVSVSIFALVPPNEGIHATLANNGVSYAVVREPFDRFATIYRLPESVALSSPTNATGLFELRLNDEMLLPFEGSGVDTSWRLEMSKGANRFDYSTIVDVLFTIRYTALEDRTYRGKVLLEMGIDESGLVDVEVRKGFSIRNAFPDQWYHFFNPADDAGVSSRKIDFELNTEDFPPNEQARKVKRVTVMLQLASDASQNEQLSIPVGLAFEAGTPALLPIRSDQVAQATDEMRGNIPYGTWTLTFRPEETSPVDATWLERNLQDIVVVLDYKAKVHYNR